MILVFILMGIGTLGVLYRLSRGPSAANRMVALDALTTLITGLIILLAIHYNSSFLLDVALIYAFLSFGFIVIGSRYLERGL